MKKLLMVAAFSAAFSASAWACEAPQNKPEIPDPSTAVTAQMVKSNNLVREYVQAKEAYLNCARLSNAELRRQESALKAFADEFNQAIREFRSVNG
ncbi:hypothetical protein [Marinimicrobium sp. ABcell2]|uniref:hypothetical protein n=1 Tax=Marinimicrobium sp. ABcell2 TaxID=3069751 RepID=UPI0027AF348B|nr:hypothetical protein [Marinimicrobium sp. ABcell2]MDQ2075123.1 hypothetical protein [Marinimicrobium sp. ABcell2]